MLVTNKHFTPVLGLDLHIVILFGFPIPLPHPFIGLVIDPMDYIPFMGASTWVNHVPRGKSDTNGMLIFLFHIPMGGPFLLAPMIGHDSVNFFGAKRVKAEGNLLSPSGHMLMTCNDIGMPLSLRPGKKLIPIPSLYLPTSFSIPLSFGKPVMVGGPYVPDWAGVLLNLIMSYGFGALMKGVGKLGKKGLTKFNQKLQKKIGSNKLSNALCKKGLEPVDLVQGIVIYDYTDFELPGPIPLRWERSWNSDSPFEGLLGRANHLKYDMRLEELPQEGVTAVLLGDGRTALFDMLPFAGNTDYNQHEKLQLTRAHTDEFALFQQDNRYTCIFRKIHPQDQQYRLMSISTESGFLLSFHYNAQGHLLRIIDSAGRHLLISSDEKGRITTVAGRHRDTEKVLVRYGYNEAGDMITVTDALDQTTHITYEDHLMVKKTGRDGISFYWEYDRMRRCTHSWGDGGVMEGYIHYHPKEGYNEVTDAEGHITTYYYTPDFVIHQVKNPLGDATFYEYTPEMEIYRVIDAEGNVTGYTYDERGNKTSMVKPDGTATTAAYDEQGRIVSVRDAEGNTRTFIYYEQSGLLHTVTEADGRISIYRYNEQMLMSRVEEVDGGFTAFSYDEDYNLQSLTRADGAHSEWEYDAWGKCLRVTNPFRERQEFRYDALGRATDIWLPDGNHIELTYNEYQEVIHARDKQHDVRYEYTALGSLKKRDENGQKTHYIYNKDEQLTAIVNPLGETYRFSRDSAGQIVSETGFDGLVRHFERDSTGKVIRVHRPGQQWTHFEYTTNGDLARVEWNDGSWETFNYDRNGQIREAANNHGVVRFERNGQGRITTEWQDGCVIQSQYNTDGKRTALKSSLGADIQMKWDRFGELTGIAATTEDKDPWIAHIQRNLLGLEIERTLPGGIKSSWTYHPGSSAAGTPDVHQVHHEGNVTRHRQYHWDANQRLKQVLNALTRGTINYGYDEWSNLAWAQYEDGSYDYRLPDKGGNLYKTQSRKDRKYSEGGRLLETDNARFEYSPEGFLRKKIVTKSGTPQIWEYEWYGNGMLKSVLRPDQKTVSFRYDALGRRTEKIFNGRVTRYVWDANKPLHEWSYPLSEKPVTAVNEYGELVMDRPEPVPPETLVTWVFDEGTMCPAAKLTATDQYTIITDHLGTPCEAYNREGKKIWSAELDIYGNVRKLEGSKDFIPFRFQGQYEDVETGLFYNRFRYYSPEEGLYISQDPIGLLGNGASLYAYVKDPNAFIDVFGLECRKAQLRKLNVPEGPGVYHIEHNGEMYTGSADNLLERLASGEKKHKKATEMLFDAEGKLREDVKLTIKKVDMGDVSKTGIGERRGKNHILRSFEQEVMDDKTNIPGEGGSQNSIRAAAEKRVDEFMGERTKAGADWVD
ncbi:RHS repeat-associated core domain-containing protein [Chitinophaga qingshengii]|uniref:RHS domain-containing protein n=1 Tax=Chitinophaga qingshengii TaxID=1569794 RepID=A0ABR7TR87_9BACT|nr:RHS repeat-associated core domain-containing protein [Chitinophaga qingshengii]MBC9932140.1 RHS domain-containing protein [Chitinophaga qingshengii]